MHPQYQSYTKNVYISNDGARIQNRVELNLSALGSLVNGCFIHLCVVHILDGYAWTKIGRNPYILVTMYREQLLSMAFK